MSASLEQVDNSSQYEMSAYRSDKPIAEKVIPPKGLWELSIRKGTPLPFTQPSSVVSSQLATGFKPSQYRDIKDKLASGERHLYWNETILKEEKMSGWGGLYLTTSVVAKFIALYMIPFSCVVTFFLALFSQYFSFNDLLEYYYYLFIYLFIHLFIYLCLVPYFGGNWC